MLSVLYYFSNIQTNMFQWQKYHFMDELAEHDCHFEIISPLDYGSIEEANEVLLKSIQEKQYDIFMTSYNEDYLEYDTIKAIKNAGVATLLFCPDNLVVPYNHKHIARYFDLVWLTSKETQYLFNRWKAKSIFLPYAANPHFLVPYSHDYEELRVGFIGTPHGSRISAINSFVDNGIPVTIHTSNTSTSNIGLRAKPVSYIKVLSRELRYPIGWKLAAAQIIDKLQKNAIHSNSPFYMLEPPVALRELAALNSKYALTLSFTNANSTGVLKHPVKIVNLRNFELPMSGAIQFCEYSHEMAEYFEDDKEIVMYRNAEEAIDKANYYLDPSKDMIRKNIREAARLRAERDHTWFNRFNRVFTEFGLQNHVR